MHILDLLCPKLPQSADKLEIQGRQTSRRATDNANLFMVANNGQHSCRDKLNVQDNCMHYFFVFILVAMNIGKMMHKCIDKLEQLAVVAKTMLRIEHVVVAKQTSALHRTVVGSTLQWYPYVL